MNYAYWLSNIPGIGNRTIRRLIFKAGCAAEIYALKEQQLLKITGIGPEEAARILNSKNSNWESGYEDLCRREIFFLSEETEGFPEKLKNIPDAPYSIYVKGRLPDPKLKSAAIVGARMCSEYGHAMAKAVAKELAAHGVCVVSGMAKGIDTDGHVGALEAGGTTYAVLGCGIDVCYPAANRSLYDRIQKNGGILSEYPPGMQPHPGFFPARNRIISALSDVVVVVEAKERSGSLITADLALEQGKDIYAVPGRISDTLSAGCNALIGQGAGIIVTPFDFVKQLGLSKGIEAHQENFHELLLEKDERLVYSCVDLRPKSMEELLMMTGFEMPQISDVLAKLKAKELVAETFKNCYIRNV